MKAGVKEPGPPGPESERAGEGESECVLNYLISQLPSFHFNNYLNSQNSLTFIVVIF